MVELDTIEDLQNSWRDPYALWYAFGMPAFTQHAKDPWKQITIKFRTKEDRLHFAELLDYKLTEKTKVVWFPFKDRDPNSTSRYVEQGYEQDKVVNIEEDEDE